MDGKKPRESRGFGEAYGAMEEEHMRKVLSSIDLPEPHRFGPVVLFTDYLSVVAELYSTVMTYQQLIDGLQKQNRFLIGKIQARVDESKPFLKDMGEHETEQ